MQTMFQNRSTNIAEQKIEKKNKKQRKKEKRKKIIRYGKFQEL